MPTSGTRTSDIGSSGWWGPTRTPARGSVEVLGDFDDLDRILDRTSANGVVMSLGSVCADTVNVMTRRLTDAGYHVALSSLLHDIDVTRLRPQTFDGRTMVYVEPVVRGGWRAVAKRGFDIVLAATILLLSGPVLLVSMIAIKLDSRGPVLFRQERIGRNGRTFELIKLRSMGVDAESRKESLRELNEADGPLFKMTEDPRVTRVGRLLRKLSIDELPQLVCVLPRHDEHGRAPPGTPGRGRTMGRTDPGANSGQAGPHRPLAGVRAV